MRFTARFMHNAIIMNAIMLKMLWVPNLTDRILVVIYLFSVFFSFFNWSLFVETASGVNYVGRKSLRVK